MLSVELDRVKPATYTCYNGRGTVLAYTDSTRYTCSPSTSYHRGIELYYKKNQFVKVVGGGGVAG